MKHTSLSITALLSLVAGLSFAADVSDSVAAVQKALEENKPLEGPATWNTTFTLGGSMTHGNSETLVSNARLATEKLLGTDLFNGSIEAAYGEAEQEDEEGNSHMEKNVDNMKLVIGHKHRFDGFFTLFDGVLLTDDIADIDYRTLPTLGLGTFLVDTDSLKVTVQAGAGYLWEKVGGVKDDYMTFVVGERGRLALSERASVWEQATYVGSVEDSEDSLVSAEVGADAAMNSTVKLGVVLTYTYDNTPAEGKEKDDLALTAQISFSL